MLNITTFLDANSKRLSKDVFYCPERNTKYSSGEILSIISEIGRILKSKGISKGDRILIYLNNCPEYLFTILASWRIGAVVIPSNRIFTKDELKYMVDDSDAKLIVTDNDVGDETLNHLGIDYYIPSPDEMESYKNKDVLPAETTDWDDLCQLQYTSGTTGRPKGSMLTHGNWFSAIHNEADVLSLKQNDVALIIYPMAHVGLSWAISALSTGALYIMMEQYNIDDYRRLCEEERVTVLAGMPPVIHTLTTHPEYAKQFNSVREIISGGGPLHKKIWKQFQHIYGIPVINAYGLSETIVIGTGTVIRPEDYFSADRFESVGHPVCFSEVKIVDPDNADIELPEYEQGEIALRGPSVAVGYWNMPEATKETFRDDGWFLTGDIGYLDQDNRLFITDRKKDMIVMSGWKVYPTEVEEILIKHPAVEDIAVFSIDDCHKGELPVAAVIWKDDIYNEDNEDELKADLNRYARKKLARYKVPRKYFTTSELPRVNGWKLLRRELKEEYNIYADTD